MEELLNTDIVEKENTNETDEDGFDKDIGDLALEKEEDVDGADFDKEGFEE